MNKLKDKYTFFAYTDNVAILKRIPNQEDKDQFDSVLQTLLEWADEYGMKWSPLKTQRMMYRKYGTPMDMYFGGDEILPQKVTIESLGRLFDKECVPHS